MYSVYSVHYLFIIIFFFHYFLFFLLVAYLGDFIALDESLFFSMLSIIFEYYQILSKIISSLVIFKFKKKCAVIGNGSERSVARLYFRGGFQIDISSSYKRELDLTSISHKQFPISMRLENLSNALYTLYSRVYSFSSHVAYHPNDHRFPSSVI